MMNKIAFVVVRYGKDINGGAELHCRMLAERLVGKYQVEVLTTCVKNYVTGKNEYPEGEEWTDGVLVRRFKADPIPVEHIRKERHRVRTVRRWRRFFFLTHLLGLIARFIPVWKYKTKSEIALMNNSVFYSSAMFKFIREHKDDYQVLIPISADWPQLYYTALYAPEKTLVIPTLHRHDPTFRACLTSVFTRVAYIGFNTTAEQHLAQRLFGSSMSPHGIISVSFEQAPPADWTATREKYHLPDEYLLYIGRIDADKMADISNYFLSYKQKYPHSLLKLVLIGQVLMDKVENPDFIYTGFVNDAEKTAILQHAKIVINPSKYESLSLILLEALSAHKPMLVNGHCNVLKEHVRKSRNAVMAYYTKRDFIKKLHQIDSSEALCQAMGERGAAYVTKNYNWDTIMQRLTGSIEHIIQQNKNKQATNRP